MRFLRSTALAVFFVIAFSFTQAFAAQISTIESNRAHATTGANGCTVSGATVATPSVVTCAAAHHLIDGDPIQITGVGGTTTINTVGYAKITGYSPTTFGFYSDPALSTGITGTGSYTSGGAVTTAYDVSGVTGDFTLKLRIESMTSLKHALISIQESQDGFVSDIRTLQVIGLVAPNAGADYLWKARSTGFNRFGTSNTRIRAYIQALDSSTTVNWSFWLQQ